MLEVDDTLPEEPQVAEAPPPPELKRAAPLREKMACPDCGKSVSKHTLLYGSHKKTCKAKKAAAAAAPEGAPEAKPVPEEALPVTEAPAPAPTEAPPAAARAPARRRAPAEPKPPLSRREVEKPLKQKRLTRQDSDDDFLPDLSPPQGNWYEQMIHMRNQQALARNQAMLAPYQAMSVARRNHLLYQSNGVR